MNSLKLFICMILITIGNNCFAANEINAEIAKSLKHSINEPSITSYIFALLFVLCLIYICGIVYTKLSKFGMNTVKKEYKNIDDTTVTLLSTRQLGNNKTLHVIEIAGKRMLIGATQNSVQLIDVLSERPDSKVKTFSINTPPSETTSKTEVNIEEAKESDEDLGLYKKYLK